ncbi:MAG: excinuclease ABC subunit UvrA [Deltaproteobacteria bacterium]|nr:excinuclease ABC subunit UvrA [Deltaproteobacteria bacterium]
MEDTRLRNARTNNLRGLDLDLRPRELVVVCGVSGAGKSSLCLDTLYAEGQRRFVESFSAYARQFLERRDRPPVDSLDPVPPAIAVDRGAPVRTSRSTVGTMTELSDYLRLLWARASTLTCDGCEREVRRGSVAEAAERVLSRVSGAPEGSRVAVTYRVETSDPERYLGVRERLVEEGYRRVFRAGRALDLDEIAPSEAVADGALAVLVDRLKVAPAPHADGDGSRSRLAEALGTALARGGHAEVHFVDQDGPSERFARGLVCAWCRRSWPDPSPELFSFQTALGACEQCRGFGRIIDLAWDKIIPDPKLSLAQGALKPWTGKSTQYELKRLKTWCDKHKVPFDKPWATLKPEVQKTIQEGGQGWEGVRPWFQWLETKAYHMHVRVFLSRYRQYTPCTACAGTRLRGDAQRYRVCGLSIAEAHAMPVEGLRERLDGLEPTDEPTERVLKELRTRLGYLSDVGVGYLSLDRASRTLSGGEVQRVALTAALGTSLTGTLMVLDEPTAGLHPRDAERLLGVARGIAALGNVAVVIEHDLGMVARADRVLELGPDAGERGGTLVFDGAPRELATRDTPTGRALRERGPARSRRRAPSGWMTLRGARGHNLKGMDVAFPLGVLTVITGVSGSGKSSLIGETLHPALARSRGEAGLDPPLPHDGIDGSEKVRAVVYVDQGSLGRTTRGNAATYLKVYDRLRTRFAATAEAKARGYTTRMFSFNVDGGRCPACQGAGYETVEMQFLADVSFKCPDCQGRRFKDEVLEIRVLGRSIAELLDTSADALAELFAHTDPGLLKALEPLRAVGLGYLKIGQPLSTLSGGEAQRLKLAAALVDARSGDLVLLDEPTTGLHRRDVARVFDTLDALVARGVTVLVIEHDPYVAARADYLVDLGPEAADAGGEVVACGTPEEVSVHPRSRIAPYLRTALALDGEGLPGALSEGPPEPSEAHVERGVRIVGAREHNLQVPFLELPREKLIAMTGPSGSGKSSLAFDVVYAEGQRRFLETLSPYARQYLPSLGRADVDAITGIPPAISLEQRTARAGGMSTVATVTEVAHALRLLFAKVATPHCPKCAVPIGARSAEAIVEELGRAHPPRASLSVFAPVVRARKGFHEDVLDRARRQGIEAVRVDGVDYETHKVPALKKTHEHDVWLWLGAAPAGASEGLLALVRKAVSMAEGHCVVERDERSGRVGEPLLVSTRRACPKCGMAVPELDPRHFSFNTPQGRCLACEGSGVDEEGAVCGKCRGTRLGPIPRAVRLGGRTFPETLAHTPGELLEHLRGLSLGAREALIAEAPRAQLEARLSTLVELGLDYLTLERRAATLSGGELQRLRLAAQLGSGLTGVLYVLDEPTIGLHGSDTHRLVRAMRHLVDRGASVVVVEHDADVIRAADWVVDLGPGGGKAGGRVVASGPGAEVLAGDGPTARALTVRPGADAKHRPVDAQEHPHLTLKGARGHNLQVPQVRFPLERFVCVAGVSGSGKSTLVDKILLRSLFEKLKLKTEAPLEHQALEGWKALRRAVCIDQSPIGRTPRSVPATYVGIWDELRRLFAATAEARARGWGIGRFSFNTTSESGGGRCEGCDGGGVRHVEMAFLPDMVVPCEACAGSRFTRETREVKLHGYDVGEVLALTVEEARQVFRQVSRVARALDLLHDLGLGYMTLGQGSHTLSGGEAQRIKLVTELQSGAAGTMYFLDEPTTGLHLSDVARLTGVLQALVDRGNSLLVIEHHPWVLAAADWVVELGPGGGRNGGRVIAEGTPEALARGPTATGQVLREAFGEGALAATGASSKRPLAPTVSGTPPARRRGPEARSQPRLRG